MDNIKKIKKMKKEKKHKKEKKKEKKEKKEMKVTIEEPPAGYLQHKSMRIHPGWVKAVVSGKSESGKTTFILNMLENEIHDFGYCIIVSRTLYKPIYQNFIKRMKERGVKFKLYEKLPMDFNLLDAYKEKFLKCPHNVCFFDDLQFVSPFERKLLLAQVLPFFSEGRNYNCSVLFSNQAFFEIPNFIRQERNHAICFKSDDNPGLMIREMGLNDREKILFKDILNERNTDPELTYKPIILCSHVKMFDNSYRLRLGYDMVPLDELPIEYEDK